MRLSEAAPAKVNLYLHVIGRRDDGYHLLDSLAVFAAVADRLEAEAAPSISLTVAGPMAAGLREQVADNLVMRAARLLAERGDVGQGATILLRKNLPLASGIGGGSADAAATLRLLSRLWRLDLPLDSGAELTKGLGADVPVCLSGLPARMGGVGEVLAPAPALPGFGLVLLNPGVAVPTAAVFRARHGQYSTVADLPRIWPDAASMATDLSRLSNDLEPAALSLCPAIADALLLLRQAPGCLLARMSGSGATCFGLFASPHAAVGAAASLSTPTGWWVWGGGLAPAPQ